jgi:uncharacterized protein
MSASNLLSQEKPVSDRRAYEPSMEEILASIRRIIADDQAFAAHAPASGDAAAQSPEKSEPENVAKPVKVAAATAASKPRPAVMPPAAEIPMTTDKAGADGESIAQAKPAASARNPEFVREVKAAAATTQAAPRTQNVARLSPEPEYELTGQSKAPVSERRDVNVPEAEPEVGLKGSLEPSEPGIDEPLVSEATDQAVTNAFNALIASRFAPTSETMNDMVREMIRPMLKVWLDDNLPIMVERLVRTEIERVARGGR